PVEQDRVEHGVQLELISEFLQGVAERRSVFDPILQGDGLVHLLLETPGRGVEALGEAERVVLRHDPDRMLAEFYPGVRLDHEYLEDCLESDTSQPRAPHPALADLSLPCFLESRLVEAKRKVEAVGEMFQGLLQWRARVQHAHLDRAVQLISY